MEFGGARKRGMPAGSLNGNGGFKRSKQEMEYFTSGIGSKSKPCTKFFSPSGCPFGEGCHFLHYIPGGIKAVTQILGNNPAIPAIPRNPVVPPPFPDGPAPVVKTRLCNKYKTAEGCKFGEKCHFAHGEWELGKPMAPSHDDPRAMGQMGGRFTGGRMDPTPNFGPAATFGASATAKISIDASLAGAVIGKGGVNSKQICRVTGARLSIRDHEVDPNLRNIELEGTFDQIKQASQMVRELIVSVSAAAAASSKHSGNRNSSQQHESSAASNYKTKLCDNFNKGACTFGERCHFAHGAEELRRSGL
ncbi:zinc finger CCCH domain-containing protein 44-like [Andrographis paniculata]|uniref:zinc finger CCCH domain-containing protein 44-like n=1 Tax=Andrographis paniculata TaxID=175694 RepID=UPI0021E8B37E|nr:zinc finger CCCH domain-containing protein 44-like [Andrographis paniculata]